MLPKNQILVGHVLDLLKSLPSCSIHLCVTSPPYYGLREYHIDPVDWPEVTYLPISGLPESAAVTIESQTAVLGLEEYINAYVGHLVLIFREIRRVLRTDGVCFLNIGDSSSGSGRGGKQGKTGQLANRGIVNARIQKNKARSPKGLK